MITKNHFDIYKAYNGDIDGIYRTNDKKAKALFDNNDNWSIISNLLQDVFLVKTNRCSEEFKKQTMARLEATIDKETIPLIWSAAGQL